MSRYELVSATLLSGECHRDESVEEADLRLNVDCAMVDDWHEASADGRLTLRVGLRVGLDTGHDEVCHLRAVFLLVYRGGVPPDDAGWKRLMVEQGVPDAWPLWRLWVHSQLALMELPPTDLRASAPEAFLTVVREGLSTGTSKPAGRWTSA